MITPEIMNSDDSKDSPNSTSEPIAQETLKPVKNRWSPKTWWIIFILITYLIGLGSGYGIRGLANQKTNAHSESDLEKLAAQVNPRDGYPLPVSLKDLGPQMVKAGVFDREQFIQVYQQAGKPLSETQLAMLDGTYDGVVTMDQANAYFLLNYFWALGLSSSNPILESGPITQNAKGKITGFASTGGWTLATRPVEEIYSSIKFFNLSAEQQANLEETAKAVYRPCCDNPTHFPDCNHGMAMLGLLELMASQGASQQEMLDAAKYVNAFWYPQQSIEQAAYFQKAEGKAFKDVDAAMILGPQFSSGSGFAALHQYMAEKDWLPKSTGGGGSCGV